MTSFIGSFFEKLQEDINPAYKKDKEIKQKEIEKEREYNRAAGLIATAVSVASAVFAVLGIVFSSAPIILVSLPLGFFSLNIYKVTKNYKDLMENPEEYTSFSNKQTLNNIKNKLEQGTVCFSWIIDYAIEQIKVKK